MKRLSVPPLAVVCLAVVACLTGQAGAAGHGGTVPGSFPRYGYAGYNLPAAGYGYAGYGYGGYVGYGPGGSGPCSPYGGCNVKMHNRHPPLPYKCGPNAGGACSYVYGYPTTWGPFHRCHLWRTKLLPCSAGGCGIYGPTFMDPTPAQPQTGMPTEPISFPTPVESLQPPAPSLDDDLPPYDAEPLSPLGDSST